jgi:hypothetical protein
MPLPEGYLPREGDVLVLHGRVKYDVERQAADHDEDGKLTVWVRLLSDFRDCRVPLETVVGVHRRKWDAGAKVRTRADHAVFGEIVAVHEDAVWLQLDGASKRPGNRPTKHPQSLLTLHCNEIEPMPAAYESPRPPPAPGDSPTRTWESDQGPRPLPNDAHPAIAEVGEQDL